MATRGAAGDSQYIHGCRERTQEEPAYGRRRYEAGDEAAKAVVEKACRELALLVEPVARVLHMEDGVLALTGSILPRDKAVREGSAALLRMRFPGMRLAEPKSDAAAGAALLALETLNTEKGENKNA